MKLEDFKEYALSLDLSPDQCNKIVNYLCSGLEIELKPETFSLTAGHVALDVKGACSDFDVTGLGISSGNLMSVTVPKLRVAKDEVFTLGLQYYPFEIPELPDVSQTKPILQIEEFTCNTAAVSYDLFLQSKTDRVIVKEPPAVELELIASSEHITNKAVFVNDIAVIAHRIVKGNLTHVFIDLTLRNSEVVTIDFRSRESQ